MRVFDLVIFTVLFLVLSNCEGIRDGKCRDGVSQFSLNKIDIQRTEKALFDTQNPNETLAFFQKNKDLANYFWHKNQYPNDSVLALLTFRQLSNPVARDTLYREAVAAFNNAPQFNEELAQLFSQLRLYYPEAPIPKVKTAINFFYNDLFVSDSLIAIGLEFFVGKNATFAPDRDLFPEYVLRRYNYEHLAAMIAFFIAGNKVTPGTQKTLLSEMIDYGKTLYFASHLLPCTAEKILIGYDQKTLSDVKANQEIIWAYLVENQLLYTTNHHDKRKFIEERPKVYEIGEKCPGRIGQWIGWQIVEGYMKKNKVTIQELLINSNHHQIFENSGYKPKNQ